MKGRGGGGEREREVRGVLEIWGEHMVFRESKGGDSLSQQRIKERLQKKLTANLLPIREGVIRMIHSLIEDQVSFIVIQPKSSVTPLPPPPPYSR